MTVTASQIIEQIETVMSDTNALRTSQNRRQIPFLTEMVRHGNRTNHYMVDDISDFPKPVNGIITLEANTEYELNGLVDIGTNEIHYSSGSSIYGHGPTDGILYTGTGTALNSTGNEIRIYRMTITAPNGTGFEFTGTSDQLCVFNLMAVVGCKFVGEIAGFNTFAASLCRFAGVSETNRSDNGLVISSSITEQVVISTCLFAYFKDGANMIELNGSLAVAGLNINGNVFDNGSTALAIYQSPTVQIEYQGLLTNNNFFHGDNAVDGFGPGDVKWLFSDNIGVPDSQVKINYFITTPVQTTIDTVSTPVKIAGVTTRNPAGQRFTHDVNNRAVYTGLRPVTVDMTISISITTPSQNQLFEVLAYKNGVQIQGARTEIRIDTAGDVQSGVVVGTTEVDINDYIEVWIQNLTGTANVTADSLSVVITE